MNKWSVDSAMQEGQSLEDIAITIALLVVCNPFIASNFLLNRHLGRGCYNA